MQVSEKAQVSDHIALSYFLMYFSIALFPGFSLLPRNNFTYDLCWSKAIPEIIARKEGGAWERDYTIIHEEV